MSITSDNNKRIAKNTLYLYLRMSVTLLIGLFTSRVTLNALGVHDYGLLSVVGGVVSLMSYANSLLYLGTSRFLTIALGKGDEKELKNTFSACFTLHLVIAGIVLLVGETVGLWFVNNKLVVDSDRMFAANVVYQLSLFYSCISVIQSPYSASVVSHERMSAFAYMSIFDVVAKLFVVILLLYVATDKLILYQSLYFLIGLLSVVIYRNYCNRNFSECNMRLYYNKALYKDLWKYIGWNSLGMSAYMLNAQGVTVLLNLFFDTAVNAARGIALTVCDKVYAFMNGFQTAVIPQIMKCRAQENFSEMNRLILNSAKYSTYLLLLVGMPIMIETDYVIQLWLGQVPEYVVPFIHLTLFQMMLGAIDSPVNKGIHAFGEVKLLNMTASLVNLSILPIIYVCLHFGASPVSAYIVAACIFPLTLVIDILLLRKYTGFSIRSLIYEAFAKLMLIILISVVIPLLLCQSMERGFLRFVVVTLTSVLFTSICIYNIGLSKTMRQKVMTKLKLMRLMCGK
ncbi:hypothetical protein E5358_07300 [Palleniella muris]|uniref:Uncharacterized protein n=1 Tax=Palleniella muris TaxID=3038145 RepID=A0AC61QQR8_9BACT|nr:hypothetical protein [Palleniella muris]TGX82344.1 hypothetical protein E5358_07300 [Palleniella muris]